MALDTTSHHAFVGLLVSEPPGKGLPIQHVTVEFPAARAGPGTQ